MSTLIRYLVLLLYTSAEAPFSRRVTVQVTDDQIATDRRCSTFQSRSPAVKPIMFPAGYRCRGRTMSLALVRVPSFNFQLIILNNFNFNLKTKLVPPDFTAQLR